MYNPDEKNVRRKKTEKKMNDKSKKSIMAALCALMLIFTAVCAFAGCWLNNYIGKPEGDPGASEQAADPSAEAAAAATAEATAEASAEQTAQATEVLRLTEIVNGPQGWVELENAGAAPAELSAYTLTDDIAEPAKYRFPADVLAPGELAVVELTGEGGAPYTASFKVSRSENGIFLFRGNELVSKLMFSTPMPEGVSAVCAEDGVRYTAYPTKGEPNSDRTFASLEWTDAELSDPSTVLMINEALADNKYGMTDQDGDRCDWVELMNVSDDPVDLSYYYISDDPEEPLKFRLPKVSLLPHKYVLIFLSEKEGTNGEIHASFKLSPGETIVLAKLDGMKLDKLEIPEGINPNVSVGRGAGNAVFYYPAPTPGSANTTYGYEKYADAGAFNANSVYFSEVCAVTAPRSGESDWIELYNGGSSAVSLVGWSITDDPFDLKYTISSLKLGAGDYAAISCSKLGFSVSNAGETLYLFDSEGALRDEFRTGATTLGMTSGRDTRSNSSERVFFTTATRGYKNSSPLSGCAAEPVFSRNTLYAGSAFELSITSSTPGAEVRYTTDGSTPTRDSKLCSGPITVSKNVVIKARAFRDGMAPSPVAAHTFVFGSEHTLPVVCLSMSGSDYSRMYTAVMGEGGGVTKGDEVPCFMEYFVDGRLAISSGAGVRVSGASTAVYPQKSLALYFRAGYGRSSLDIPLFPGCKVSSFRSLVLRNSGQDASFAHIRDSFVSKAARDFNIDSAAFRPVIVYINGDYRGIYDLKENLNEDYLVSHHGAVRSHVETIRRNGKAIAGTSAQFKSMLEMCRTLDFSKQENFDKLKKLVDTDSIMDYLILRTYFTDADMYNQKYWHTTDNKLRWRSVLYDSDYALMGNYPGASVLSTYFNPNGFISYHGFYTQMDIFCACNQNKAWRDKFITRYIWAVKYRFDPDRLLPVYDALVNQYKPEMKAHIARWHMPSSYDKWLEEVEGLRNCLKKRPEYALKNLKSFYGLSDAEFNKYVEQAKKLAGG